MDVLLEQRCEAFLHEPVTLAEWQACKSRRHDAYKEVPAAAGRACVPRMRGAVVEHLEIERREVALEQAPNALDAFSHVPSSVCAGMRRASHITCTVTNTNVIAVRPKTLKFTHTTSLALRATARFAAPSSA